MTNKLVVILGPISAGKSSLAIKLAKKFDGEIISADSRQVYKGMDLGTGKVSKSEQRQVKHYLLDVANPKTQFSVEMFVDLAKKAQIQIESKRKLPFLVGGTAFYIYSFIDGLEIPAVKPSLKLRKSLEKKSTKQLFAMLKKLDPVRAKAIDPHNPARLIRAIEINVISKKPVPALQQNQNHANVLILGIKQEHTKLKQLIHSRLLKRVKQGMIKEAHKLLKSGVTHNRLQKFGLEYKYLSLFLQNKITRQEFIQRLSLEINQFAKRQMTWFKRDSRIQWINTQSQAERLIKKFLR